MVWSLVRNSMPCRAPNDESSCSRAEPAPIWAPVRVYGRSHHSDSIVVSIGSTISGVASVRTPMSPIGQSEFSMSMTC